MATVDNDHRVLAQPDYTVSYKYVHEVLVNRLFKLAQENSG